MTDKNIDHAKFFQTGQVFTPSAPINKLELFSGRSEQVRSVINAINQVGQHVVIYGERGVGKTSLVTVLHDFLPNNQGIINVKVNADPSSTFDNLFHSVMGEVRLTFKRNLAGFGSNVKEDIKSLEDLIDKDRNLNPNELRFIFRSLGMKVIIIIDEFDRIEDATMKQLMADTLKNFSDYGLDVTFVLVGVANTVEELITEHHSTERALAQIQMPRMSRKELEQIIDTGFSRLGMTIDAKVKDKLISLSQGLPHYVHLLSLHAAQAAIENGSVNVGEKESEIAIVRSIEQTEQTVRHSYYKAVSSPQGNMFPQVLLACALAENDEMGYFAASDARRPLQTITGRSYEISAFARHLKEFCGPERGPILRKIGQLRKYRYRFLNPLLEPFVILKGLSENIITDADLGQGPTPPN